MSLEGILLDGRAEFNRRVALARKAKPALEVDSLTLLLKEGLAFLVDACESAAPDRTSQVVSEGFDLALRVAALGPKRGGFLENVLALWRSLSRCVPLWCVRPGYALGRATGALLNLREQQGFRVAEWVEDMGAPETKGTTLEQRAVFLGWTCGFPVLREAALALAKDLPPEFLAMALRAKDAQVAPYAVENLKQNRWWGFAAEGPKVVEKLGGFEGADGLFAEPPVCHVSDGRLLVDAAGKRFRLYADRFGACLHPLGGVPATKNAPTAKQAHPWSDRGLILPRGSVSIPIPKDARRSVEVDGLIAVWTPFSYWIWVVAP